MVDWKIGISIEQTNLWSIKTNEQLKVRFLIIFNEKNDRWSLVNKVLSQKPQDDAPSEQTITNLSNPKVSK